MKGHDRVVELLNELLTAELTTVNQYFLNSRMCENWGLHRLAHKHYEASIEEMNDADALIQRILYLEGMPNLQRLGNVAVGEDPVEQLHLAVEREREWIGRLNEVIAEVVELGDTGTRELLAEILTGEEEHLGWLEVQFDVIDRLGETVYLAEQLHD